MLLEVGVRMSSNLSERGCAFTSLPLPGIKTKQKQFRETRLSLDFIKRLYSKQNTSLPPMAPEKSPLR